MFLNAMAKVAAKEGMTIKQLLERRRKEAEKLPPRKPGSQSPKDVTPLKGSRRGSCICAGRWIKGDTNGSN